MCCPGAHIQQIWTTAARAMCLLKKHALEDLLGSSFSSNQVTGGIQAEIDSYCKEALVSLSACPLKWWRDNAGRYPILSSLAKTYLCIPATSVPSERVFSIAGDMPRGLFFSLAM